MRGEQQVAACVVMADPAAPTAKPGGSRLAEVTVRHGEHPRDAAVRAAAEQLGVIVEVLGVREVTSQVEDPTAGGRRHVLRVVYDAASRPGAPQAPPEPAGPPSPEYAPVRVQRPGAYAVVAHDGRILLTRLSYAQVWTLPGGGIDHGESPLDAVVREVREETGLPLADPRLVDVDSVHFTGHGPDGTLEDFHAIRFLYTGTVPLDVEPRVVEVGGSSDAAPWLPIDGLGERERRRLALALSHVR